MKHDCLLNLPRGRRLIAMAVLAFLSAAGALSASAAPITGIVTNGTTKRPAAGDPVVLISLTQQMQEIARTKTDANGHFSIVPPDPGMHLLRVDHQGAAYFEPAPPNTPNVNIEVYNVAAKVPGVSTEANVLRVETDQQGLEVIQNYFVKNASDPPLTQSGDRSYEIYLPSGAVLDGSAAMSPGGMPVRSSPVPLGKKGHYAFPFPLRPGETRFQLSYHLPYSGSFAFTPHLATAEANFVVMLPKSMTFKPGPGTSYQPIDQPPGVQTFLARNVTPSQPLAFTLSGTGSMPRDTGAQDDSEGAANGAGQSAAGQDSAATGSAAADTRPGIGLGKPIDTPDPLTKYKWWILGGIGLIFAIGAGLLLRPVGDATPLSPLPAQAAAVAPVAGAESNTLLVALKNEIFALETDRVQGRLSETEYGELKSALELVLRRALSRQPA